MHINILGWSILLVFLAGLVILVMLRNRSRQRRALAPLKAFAAENGTLIAECDWWDKTSIGMDTGEPATLFFLRKLPEKDVREKINLREVSDCRMYKISRNVSYKKENISVIDRIELVLSFYDLRPGLTLEFYNNDYDSLTLTGELQLAQKWADVIKQTLRVHRDRKVLPGEKSPAA